MPILTDDEYQTIIGKETGALDFADDFNVLFPLWWKLYAAKSEDLRYLWTKLRTCEFLMGEYRKRYDVVRGTDQSRISQQFANAAGMADRVIGELKNFDPQARGVDFLQVGQMRSTMPDAIEAVRRFDLPGFAARRLR